MTTVDFAQARRAYEWLDHHRLPESYTELVALHPDYRPGKEYYERNKTRDLFPKTRYAQTPRDLESFVISYADSRMVCIGLNPRPKAFRDTNGYVRGARETEIAISTACLWDFDFADQAGRDAFRTATGVHAAAIIKAYKKDDVLLANSVYSGVPSHYFGLEQVIEVGPLSGRSNVIYWLEKHGIPPGDELVDRIFAAAKRASCVLTEKELRALCNGPAPAGKRNGS